MTLPRYPEYRESGVEWLGEVPEHWACAPIKVLATIRNGSTPSRERPDFWSGGDYPWLNSGVVNCDPVADADQFVTAVALRECHLPVVQPPAVVVGITGQGRTRGMASMLTFECTISQHLAALKPRDTRLDAHFLKRVLEMAYTYLRRDSDSAGSTKGAITCEELGNFKIICPPNSEQTQIAEFLDRETAKIDALVAEQQRLVELLKEKRQALIFHAVTKGLNPNAPMKDSGIEWLGEVPAHWELRRIKHISPFVTVGIVVNPSTYVSAEGRPFIYGGDIREGVIDWENSRRIEPASSEANSKTQLRSGDLLTVRVGAPGVTAVVPKECEGGNCASVMLIRGGAYSSEWLCYAMNTRIVRFQVEVVQYGAAQEQFNISHAVNFWVPTPPRGEQDAIASFLRMQTAELDALTAEATRAIDLLTERRTALISATVTGQIDLRPASVRRTA